MYYGRLLTSISNFLYAKSRAKLRFVLKKSTARCCRNLNTKPSSSQRYVQKYITHLCYLYKFGNVACACLEQVASLRSASQAHASRNKTKQIKSANRTQSGEASVLASLLADRSPQKNYNPIRGFGLGYVWRKRWNSSPRKRSKRNEVERYIVAALIC